MPVEIAPNLFAETVGEIIGDGPAPSGPPKLIVAASLDNDVIPAFPEPGIYFDLDENVYHMIPALSATGIKNLASSPMIYWANSTWLNADKLRDELEKIAKEKKHLSLGKAYHCRLMEGEDAFWQRFCIAIDPLEFPDAIRTVDQLKEAIEKHGVKPRGKSKADYIEQLKFFEPACEIWDEMVSNHELANEGKKMISAEEYRKLEVAALMIERDEQLTKAFKGGHAEVSIFWYDPATGVPMKARIDYLKLRAINDLKSISNKYQRALETAIRFEISSYHYNIQPVVYWQAVEWAQDAIRKDASVIHGNEEQVAWAKRWAGTSKQEPPVFMWVFQQTGIAPITRGVIFPRGTVYTATLEIVASMKRRWALFNHTYDVSPWLDIAPIYQIADEEIPISATEF